MTDPIAVDVNEAARLMSVSRDVIYAAAKSGRLASKKVGAKGTAIRIDVQALRDWFASLDDVAS